MKSILLKSLPFLIVFVLINLIIYATSGFYKQQRHYLEKTELAIKLKSDVIFLGDSHVETIKLLNLNTSIGNLAFGADGINEMYIKVLTMLRYNPKLKYVFIATEPQIFNNSISPNSTFLNNYLLTVKDTLDVYNKSKLNLITDKVPLFNDNYIKYVLNEIYLSFKPSEASSKKEWSELTHKQRTEIATNTGILDHQNIMTVEEHLIAFKQIIERCKLNDIKVIGIRFPVNENYINQCKEKDLIRVNNFVKTLNLYEHLDYSTEITHPKYFHDEDHLNKRGVEELAKMILRDTNINLIDH